MPVTKWETVVHSTPLIIWLDSEVHTGGHGSARCRFPSGPGEAEGSGDGPHCLQGDSYMSGRVEGTGIRVSAARYWSLLWLVGQDSSPGKTDSEMLQ